MSLYLSRICLNPLHAPSIKLAASPEALHSKLYGLVPHLPASEGRPLLFRVDSTDRGPIVLLQTFSAPDWDLLELAPRALLDPPATKVYSPSFFVGQRLSFRLLTRPSIRKAGDFGVRENGKRRPGPRLDCREDEERLEWLRWKAGDNGFSVESVGLSIVSFPAIKLRKAASETGGCFNAVQFDGILVVTNPDKLRDAVRNGIGQQKAYGFGLLSLAPIL